MHFKVFINDLPLDVLASGSGRISLKTVRNGDLKNENKFLSYVFSVECASTMSSTVLKF